MPHPTYPDLSIHWLPSLPIEKVEWPPLFCCCSTNENSNSLARNSLRKKFPQVSLLPHDVFLSGSCLQKTTSHHKPLFVEAFVALLPLPLTNLDLEILPLCRLTWHELRNPFGNSNYCLCKKFKLLSSFSVGLFQQCSRVSLATLIPCKNLEAQISTATTDYASSIC